jgi:GDP-mannose 6-dehydrogenase
MHVAVFGLGYVGFTTAACLAAEGHAVIGVDMQADKVRDANEGRAPIQEPGVDALLKKALERGNFVCVADGAEAVAACDLAMICVGTPSLPDGSHDMSHIARVTRQIAEALASVERGEPLTVVYRSTMRPGAMEGLIAPIFEDVAGPEGGRYELVHNPEFLRESSAVEDFFHPPKIVVGTRDARPNARLAKLNAARTAPTFHTLFREAELTKFIDNAFHALKVAFANEIGRISVKLGVSARTEHDIFVADSKLNISAAYLKPGGAFGGSCLPKDVRALQFLSSEVGANALLIDQLLRTNDAHKHFLFEEASRGLKPGARVLMLGLAFKRQTDDLRESPKVDLARKFLNAGFNLTIYDPWVKVAQLVGHNLGYAYMHLPALTRLLAAKEDVEARDYDLVVDVSGLAGDLRLGDVKVLDLVALA